MADAFLGLYSGRARTPHPRPSQLPTEQPERSQLPAEHLVDLFLHGALTTATTKPPTRQTDTARARMEKAAKGQAKGQPEPRAANLRNAILVGGRGRRVAGVAGEFVEWQRR